MKMEGSGRRPAHPILEQRLITWFDEQRKAKRCVKRKMIFIQATKIYEKMKTRGELPDQTGNSKEFVFSNGWLMRFMHRQKLSCRRRTTTGQKVPKDVIEKLVNFVVYTRQIRKKHNYALPEIIAADETAVWPDAVGNTTVEYRGEKTVGIRSTGHDKLRITVLLSAKADGTKLRPYVLLDRKKR